MIKLSGVVVLYEPDNEVVDNIKSYLKKLDKLYVIDNTPNKNNSCMIPKSKKIEYIPYFENRGVSYALNDAAKRSISQGYNWMLTMDQDSSFMNNEISQMLDYIDKNCDNKKIGLVSPWHVIDTNPEKPKEKIDYPVEVMTSGNIINLKAYKKIGGYKDWLFIDCIDFDYCMNLHAHNYDVVRLNYVEMKHHLGNICIKHCLRRDFVCSNHNFIRRYYMVRNTFYIVDIYKEIYPEYCSFLKRGLRGQLINIILFEKDKYRKVRNMYRGYKDYKKRRKGVYPYEN
mgnify:CR=1 FL=1